MILPRASTHLNPALPAITNHQQVSMISLDDEYSLFSFVFLNLHSFRYILIADCPYFAMLVHFFLCFAKADVRITATSFLFFFSEIAGIFLLITAHNLTTLLP